MSFIKLDYPNTNAPITIDDYRKQNELLRALSTIGTLNQPSIAKNGTVWEMGNGYINFFGNIYYSDGTNREIIQGTNPDTLPFPDRFFIEVKENGNGGLQFEWKSENVDNPYNIPYSRANFLYGVREVLNATEPVLILPACYNRFTSGSGFYADVNSVDEDITISRALTCRDLFARGNIECFGNINSNGNFFNNGSFSVSGLLSANQIAVGDSIYANSGVLEVSGKLYVNTSMKSKYGSETSFFFNENSTNNDIVSVLDSYFTSGGDILLAKGYYTNQVTGVTTSNIVQFQRFAPSEYRIYYIDNSGNYLFDTLEEVPILGNDTAKLILIG